MEDFLEETVEDLDEELRKALSEIENIAGKVYEKKIDAYEGFLQTEKYNKIVLEIGYKLKERGVDITTIAEYN
ncbi:MAG: hypothetical protein Q7U00_08605 [Sulfurimonas sp.]|nr:hypothetical protein [Sulfurimonas sp.]